MNPLLPQPDDARFDDPMSMLLACHDKVRRFAHLALKLADHLVQHGCDAQAQAAAAQILRYFTVAAPLHHQDEDDDLFPALLALQQPALSAAIRRLSAEHDHLCRLWQPVAHWLTRLAGGDAAAPPDHLHDFVEGYLRHAGAEEAEIYPAAAQLDAATRDGIGQRMQARRVSGADRSPPAGITD